MSLAGAPETLSLFHRALLRFPETRTPSPDDRDHSRKHASSLARAVTSEIRNVHGYETATTGLDFTPVHFVDVRAQMVLKMEALAAYQAMGAPRVDLRPRMAQAYARYWGRFHDFGEVEAFEDVRGSTV